MTKSIEALREQAKNVKAIFFDIDDTLRLKDEEYMPESIPGVMHQLREKGYDIGIASGRAYYGIVPEVRALEMSHFVTINGQFVRTAAGEEVYSNPIAQDVVEKIVAWAKEIGIELGFIGSGSAAVTKWNQNAADAITNVYGVLPEMPEFYKEHRVFQFLTITDANLELTIPADLQEWVRLVRWHENSSDIVPQTGSKAIGISKVLDTMGFNKEQLLVFGDELNDVEMFKYAGLSVAMGGAHETLKPLASFVTKKVEEDGIKYALEQLGILD
jgi:Cof subfamily protein (haloacid dehalogenase superfamily)